MKRLSINGRFLCQGSLTGVQRYAREVVRGIDELLVSDHYLAEDIDVELLTPADAKLDFVTKRIVVREVGSLKGHAWEQFDLPRYCRGSLLFSPCGGAPIIHPEHVITIHDVGYFATPDAYSYSYRSWYRLVHKVIARRARRVLTDSQFSKRELQHWLGVGAEKISVVVLGHEHVWDAWCDTAILDRYSLKPSSYILGVSSLNPNKNFRGLVEAFSLLGSDHRLVIAGAKNTAIFSNSSGARTDRVTWVGYVSDPELRALYENAACFVFPSIYEGFGFPPLEAMALGCPVVLSNAASVPEVGGDVAEYCDPLDAWSIADAINRTLEKQIDGTALRERAEMFKWSDCARETWDILRTELQ